MTALALVPLALAIGAFRDAERLLRVDVRASRTSAWRAAWALAAALAAALALDLDPERAAWFARDAGRPLPAAVEAHILGAEEAA